MRSTGSRSNSDSETFSETFARKNPFFEIPVGAFNQSNGEPGSASTSPIEQIAQIVFRIAQISLDYNSHVRPVAKFSFGKERSEKFERRVLVRVTFHIEVYEGAELLRAP